MFALSTVSGNPSYGFSAFTVWSESGRAVMDHLSGAGTFGGS